MRKLIFAITKQWDDVVSEKAYRLEGIIFLTSFLSLIISALAVIIAIVNLNSDSIAKIFAVPGVIIAPILLYQIFSNDYIEERRMLEDLSYEKLSESEDRKILYDRRIDEARKVNLVLNLVKADRQYRSDEKYSLQYVMEKYSLQYVLDDVKSEEFAYLYYRFDDKTIYHSRRPVYVNRIQIDELDEVDLLNRFANVKIDRIEEFDAEVKLSFEGREKIKNVKMIDVFFEVINAEDSEKKQLVYDELVERSK